MKRLRAETRALAKEEANAAGAAAVREIFRLMSEEAKKEKEEENKLWETHLSH